jgi:hypothetical protein
MEKMTDPIDVDVDVGAELPATIVLLMTATIKPRAGVKTRITDPDVRLADYQRALLYYAACIGNGIDRILFVENSGSDVSALRQAVPDPRCEFIVYDAAGHPSYGYGYGEFHLLQYAMDRYCDDEPNLLFIKVTGRYIVRNLNRFIALARGTDIVCDIRNRRQPWADLRVMAWTRRGFDRVLRDRYLLLRDDLNRLPPEMVLSQEVLASRGLVRKTFLPFELNVVGRRGMDNKDWSMGALRLRTALRAITRPIEHAMRFYPGADTDRETRTTV